MREITIAGRRGARSGGVAMQAEAVAYFQRMPATPSVAFTRPANEAIYYWKKHELWPLIKGLWLHCTETEQAARLSVNGDTPRNATIVGITPTFTSLKGYSGLDATHGVRWPITSAILADDGVYAFAAGMVDATAGGAQILIGSDAGFVDSSVVGHFSFNSDVFGGEPSGPILKNIENAAPAPFIGGSKLIRTISPAGITRTTGGSYSPRSSNYRTNPVAGNKLARISAYGFLAHTATPAQCRKFVTILARLMDELGAFD